MRLVAFSEKPLCLIDVLTAIMRADGVSPGLDEASFPLIETKGPLSREDEAVVHTIMVGDCLGQAGAIRMVLQPSCLILCKILWRRRNGGKM
jgi:hypothetical protein